MDSVGSKLRVLYDFEYETRDRRRISITKGEQLFLICKTNSDWWQVIKNSSERPFFVPAPYVIEASDSNLLSNEGAGIDNLVYDTPDFKSLCDNKQTSHSTICPNDFNRMLSEEQEGEAVQGYSLSATSKNNVQSSRVDEHEALSYCENVMGKDNILLGYRDMADGMGSKKAHAGNFCAEMECSAHTFPHGENRTFDEKSDVVALKVSLPFLEREGLTTDVARSDSASNVKKEIIGASVGNVKNKLSKSRSFKTKNELQKISRLDPTSSVLLSLESNVSDKGKFMETFSSTNCSGNDTNCDIKEKLHKFENVKDNIQIAPVPLVFHNELYNLSNNQDIETNKTMDSGNISSESLFAHDEDISDSGTSHKSGVVSSAQSRESIQEHSDILADDTSKEELASSGEEIWTTDYYEDVPIPQGWRLDYDEESGEQCYVNDVTHAKTVVRLVTTSVCLHGTGKPAALALSRRLVFIY